MFLEASNKMFLLFFIFFGECFSKEQYPWYGSDEIDADVDLLLKQRLKIGYLPKSTENGESFCFDHKDKQLLFRN